MLFNSYVFLFAFLPLTLGGFFLVGGALGGRRRRQAAVAFLVLASLTYYGWWDPAYLGLIGVSIFANFYVGLLLSREGAGRRFKRVALTFGVVLNLSLLGYFKYAGFLARSVDALLDLGLEVGPIVLPLAISFFTFQQIAYLVDAYEGKTREYSFLDYCLFVTFFPQLIAGPIVHHKEMLPQFEQEETYRPRARNLSVGAAFFTMGLFKKVVIADSMALFANPVFSGAETGAALSFADAWTGAMAYTMQLYFDFAGYSDMAIGLAAMFGIRLPVNFDSPYKATSIIDFWRRWHITLSRFLRDYLYIPLGGNRKGKARRYVNLLITMLLGGLWHGAGWTFVVWGGLHGLYLCVNHAYRAVRMKILGVEGPAGPGALVAHRAITFLAVVVGWVFFRAESFEGAGVILRAMSGADGLAMESPVGVADLAAGGQIALATLIALFLPNTNEIMASHARPLGWAPHPEPGSPSLGARALQWRPTIWHGVALGAAAVMSILFISRANEFLYFQF